MVILIIFVALTQLSLTEKYWWFSSVLSDGFDWKACSVFREPVETTTLTQEGY